MINSSAETAVAIFKSGFNCSQAVLSVFSEKLGLEQQTANRIASGFGGGIGHMGETCGAVTGAIMVISLKRGMSVEGKPYKSNEVVYGIINDLVQEFMKRNQSIRCHDLIGIDFGNEEAYREARRKGLFYEVCPKYISDAVEILESLV